MNISTSRTLVIASLLLGGGTASTPAEASFESPPAASHETDALAQIVELKRQLDRQSREIAALRREDGDTWLTEQRAGEIRGIVQDVLADADTRTSFRTVVPWPAGTRASSWPARMATSS